MRKGNSEIIFGALAVEMGYVTERQIGKAVSVQMKEDLNGLEHRLLGKILVDLGFINSSQIEDILQELQQYDKKYI